MTTAAPNGGPADALTLRDYFAAAALRAVSQWFPSPQDYDEIPAAIAANAYAVADAMLVERAKQREVPS